MKLKGLLITDELADKIIEIKDNWKIEFRIEERKRIKGASKAWENEPTYKLPT